MDVLGPLGPWSLGRPSRQRLCGSLEGLQHRSGDALGQETSLLLKYTLTHPHLRSSELMYGLLINNPHKASSYMAEFD